MHDSKGQALHLGDKVQKPSGETFHIHGAVLDDGTVIGGNAVGAHHADLAANVTLIEKHSVSQPEYGQGCIVWGDGPPPPV